MRLERTKTKRFPNEDGRLERKDQLHNLSVVKETKEQKLEHLRKKQGQLKALSWMRRVIDNQIARETRELFVIEEAIQELSS